ncbi:hypothetical protein VNI00_013910 [Paramarasmius palmivorus]|uniref:Glycoside hydrolase family 76 protein n=1 Tax=Paramarasmius palmivorus TaxID=297713 RepID=A0AAW0BXH4_9AGAR
MAGMALSSLAPNITVSPEDRVAVARSGLERAIVMLNEIGQLNDTSYGTTGDLYTQMAEFDLFTNQTIYKDRLLQYFEQAERVRPNFLDQLSYGIAGVRAYAAYQDPVFLQYAEAAWSSGKQYTLSPEDLKVGKTPVKSIKLQEKCQLVSMAGGTFWNTDLSSANLIGLATGSFLATSALLAEATSNNTYRDAAMQSANFVFSHLMNSRGEVLDTIAADTCTPSQDGAHSYNAGLVLEGLGVLVSHTKNSTLEQRTAWQDSDGIIGRKNGENGAQYLVRGLAAVYSRNTTLSNLRTYIRDYIGVQYYAAPSSNGAFLLKYNAILDNAREKDGNVYDLSWVGPPAAKYNSDAQVNALGVLVTTIPLRNDSTDTSTNTVPSPPSAPSSAHHPNVGAIVGGVVGGLALLGAVMVLILLVIRRRRRHRASVSDYEDFLQPHPQTFFAQIPAPVIQETISSQTQITTPASFAVTRNEKGQTRLAPPAPIHDASLHSGASRGEVGTHSRTLSSGSRLSSADPSELGNRIPTADLVRLLNARLQPGEWREEDVPPEYASQHG